MISSVGHFSYLRVHELLPWPRQPLSIQHLRQILQTLTKVMKAST